MLLATRQRCESRLYPQPKQVLDLATPEMPPSYPESFHVCLTPRIQFSVAPLTVGSIGKLYKTHLLWSLVIKYLSWGCFAPPRLLPLCFPFVTPLAVIDTRTNVWDVIRVFSWFKPDDNAAGVEDRQRWRKRMTQCITGCGTYQDHGQHDAVGDGRYRPRCHRLAISIKQSCLTFDWCRHLAN